MIKILLASLFTITLCFADNERKPELEIDKLHLENDKEKIFNGLKDLEKYNLNYKKLLLSDKKHQGDKFHYVVTLEQLLKKLPNKLEQMSSCIDLKAQIQHSYKEEWNDLPAPTHHIWPIFNKVCSK